MILFRFSSIQRVEQIIREIPNVKLITTRSTGFDHVDIDACKKQGIIVCNVPSY